MSLLTVELALRAATVALLTVLAAALFRDFRYSTPGRLAIALTLGSAAHATVSSIGSLPAISVWHAPLIALSTGNVVVFWLFCRALFDDSFVLRWWHALIWLAVAAFSFANCFWLAPAGNAQMSVIAINLIALGFIGLAIGQTISSWSADLVERRRRLRIFIVISVALYGGLNAILQLLRLGGDAAEVANVANITVLTGIVAAISYAMMQVTAREVVARATGEPPAKAAAVPEQDAADRKLIVA